MPDARLIERWMPIAALSEESVRERRSMTALPPIYYLHVWWARRPLIASRAAVLASLLPANASHADYQAAIGILGDPAKTRRQIDLSKKSGKDLGADPYGYRRAFTYTPTELQLKSLGLKTEDKPKVVDPTAGGGSIPFEALRLGLDTCANDLNPVAATILKATLDFPRAFGCDLVDDFAKISGKLGDLLSTALDGVYPSEHGGRVDGYLWARTICCPYCSGTVPLSPNWRLNGSGLGIRVIPHLGKGPGSAGRVCSFEIVNKAADHSEGSVSDGDAKCTFPDCSRVINGEEIKRQAQTGGMGEQLYCVVFKRQVETRLKSGKAGKPKWERSYRAPLPKDSNLADVQQRLSEKMPEWEAFDILPNEEFPPDTNDDRPRQYGMPLWRDMFSPRQLLVHGLAVELFHQLVEDDRASGNLSALRRASYVYLSFSLDKFRDYNSRMTRWHANREVIVNTFDRHDFAFKWSYAEMALMIEGLGYEWVVDQTAKCVKELVELAAPHSSEGPLFRRDTNLSEVIISSKSGALLDHIEDGTVDAVVMDPPYGANVMYAELSDFFYVWLKRTAGLVAPEFFTRLLTDKQSEAVANRAHFKGQKGVDTLANRDYQEKMASIFAESRRILKPDGIMTVMFTHKDTSAWDALTKGLIESGFIITASWPINTESEGSLHIKDKAAANSTIFLVCRPRPAERNAEMTYWEDVEPLVAKAVRARVDEFQKAGIDGVDLYLASFGPALEEFSRHWPLKRGTPRPEPLAKKRRKQAEFFEEEFDPYAVTPEDALDAARREVKTWRLNQLTHMRGKADLDPATSFYVLAWDAFKAPTFAFDEGLRLARAVGADLDQLIGRLCEKKGSDLKLWDSSARASKASIGSGDGGKGMIDALQFVAYLGRTKSLEASRKFIEAEGLLQDQTFLNSLEALLEVLPPSKSFSNVDFSGDLKSASDDFDVLEKLRRLAFAEAVDEPEQLKLWTEDAA